LNKRLFDRQVEAALERADFLKQLMASANNPVGIGKNSC
jgi:hypothetical protein